MSPTRNCSRCGAELPANAAPDQPCPRCLLRIGLSTEGGEPAPRRKPAPTVAELGPLFPKYEILELFGEGGMGAVFRARHKELGREVAIKILTLADAATGFDDRFAREARALAALSHPNIVAIHDFGKAGDFSYLVMEFVDGASLRQLLRAGRVEPRESLAMVTQICDALQYAHDRGVVHRDIKPENVLVDRQGRVKLVDFGLAKLLNPTPGDVTLTGPAQSMGTWHYMAPEQYEHPRDVDHRADIYSLGVVFYELLTGQVPVGRFEPPSKKVQVDVRIDDVVLKSLDREPDRRYQSANAVKTDVGLAGQPPPLPQRTGWHGTESDRQSPWRMIVMGLLGFMAVALGLGCLGTLAFVFIGTRANEPTMPNDPGEAAVHVWPFFYGLLIVVAALTLTITFIIRKRRALRAKLAENGKAGA
jgi:serine/threonine protein kinase